MIQQSQNINSSQQQALLEMSTAYSVECKRKPDQDPYQSLKSTKCKASSYLSTNKSSRGHNSNHAHDLAPEFAKESYREHPKKSTASTARKAIKESTETLGTASVLSKSEKPHHQALAEATLERVSPPATSAETTLVMPAKLIDYEPSSLKTEEIY